MKLRLTADLEGDTVSQATIEAVGDTCTITFHAEADGAVKQVSVEMPIAHSDGAIPRFTPGQAGHAHQISLPLPPEFDKLQKWLQYLESQGSFWFGVKRIHWSTVRINWLPENDAEKAQLNVYSSRHSTQYDRQPAPIRPQRLVAILSGRDKLEYLTIPLSFYREGVVEYESHRYINAFFNFFFFLEGLYADGRSRRAQVKEAFQSKVQLRNAVELFRRELAKPDQTTNWTGLQRWIEEMGAIDSVEGLLGLLIDMRGRVHHFSMKDSRSTAHPFNHEEFRPIAFLAMGICLGVLPQLLSGHPPG